MNANQQAHVGNIYIIQRDLQAQVARLQRRISRLPPSQQRLNLLLEIERLNEIVARMNAWFLETVRDLL